MIGGRVLDSTAVRDLTIGRTIYGAAFLAAANQVGIALAVPAVALQQAWAAAGDDDQPFLDLLLGLPMTVLDPLDADAAISSGLLGRRLHATGDWDGAAAHTVLVARQRGWPILTADPLPLRALDPGVPVELLPEG